MDERPLTPTTDLDGYVPYPDERIEEYVDAGHWHNLRFHDVVDRVADADPGRPAVVGPSRELSYGELAASSRRLAGAFRDELGLRADDTITLQLPNDPAFVEVFLACSRLGVVPAFVLPRHREQELRHVVGLTRSRAVVTVADEGGFDYVGLVDGIVDDFDHLESRVAVTAGADDELPEAWHGMAALRAHDKTVDGSAVNPCNPGLFMLSGGTSGLPKAIPRTHNDYIYLWEHIAREMGVQSDWTLVAGLPIPHSFAFGYVLGAALWAGATVAVQPELKPRPLVDLIDRVDGDVTTLIPKQLIDFLDLESDALSTLQVVCSGGQKVPPDLVRRVADQWGAGFCNVFGMGEGAQVITRPDDPLEIQATTVGGPLGPGDEIRILDESGDPVPEGELGELVVRGPGVFTGYFRNESANAEAFEPGGWFHTGDVFSERDDGMYEVWGRLDDSINRAGETVYGPAIEDILVEHPKVAKAAVVGIPDDVLGERIGAAVELKSGVDSLTLDEVADFFESRGVAVFRRPERLTVVASLPETDVGKIDRRAVAARFETAE